jgi:hypothetical protein
MDPMFRPFQRVRVIFGCLLLLLAAVAGACELMTAPGDHPLAHEVWLIDQSDSPGRNYGGTLYIYDGDDLADPANATPRERIDLGESVSAACMAATGANPVRPHMLLFNQQQTHALLSFVASGHVALIDAVSRQAVGCVRTSLSPTGRQAHAAYPAPDGSFVVVANQNGKRIERINVDFATNTFALDPAATLDLATCTTPSGAPCQDAQLRPDNAPICPIVADDSRHTFVTLRGGGLLVVDARTTPMTIVAEYDRETVRGNGCGGKQIGSSMLVNSGGRPGNLPHLHLYGFDVYRFPVSGFGTGMANTPAPQLVYSIAGEHDSHGMAAAGPAERYVWVMDRHANAAEIIQTATMQHVGTIPLAGALTSDPAPDLVDQSPLGDRLYVALRGPTPLSGDPHIATGNTPGLGVIDVRNGGRDGELAAVLRITNVDAAGVERADAHAVRVRRKF